MYDTEPIDDKDGQQAVNLFAHAADVFNNTEMYQRGIGKMGMVVSMLPYDPSKLGQYAAQIPARYAADILAAICGVADVIQEYMPDTVTDRQARYETRTRLLKRAQQQ